VSLNDNADGVIKQQDGPAEMLRRECGAGVIQGLVTIVFFQPIIRSLSLDSAEVADCLYGVAPRRGIGT
jgi:hypothetical protein